MTNYVPARKVQSAFGVTLKTLLRREESGKIKTKCSNCGNHLPRDWNGALGNFLKALWDTTLLSSASFDCVEMTLFV